MSNPLRDATDDADEYAGLFSQVALHTQKPSWKQRYANRKISPRVRIAARLYNTGIARTLGEAARLAGLHPGTLYAMNISDNEEYNRISGQAAKDSDIATGDISQILKRLGRSALQTIEDLRINAQSETVKLKAAVDLADRSPETSKIQKVQVESFTMAGKDVDAINRALVEAAEVQGKFKEIAAGDYVRVTTEAPADLNALPPSSQEPAHDPSA